jgi:hypothetical protein
MELEIVPGERWALHIDLEGFSTLWEQEAQILLSLGELMRAIFRLGVYCYPDPPCRLFAHQMGDAFLVVSEYGEKTFDRAITIAVALMRHVACSHRLTKSIIAEGDLADIVGCYPVEVMAERAEDNTVRLGRGLMTLSSIMGTALIRPVNLDKASPRGPLLLLDASFQNRISSIIPICRLPAIGGREFLSVDWVQMDTNLLRHVQNASDLQAPTTDYLVHLLCKYCVEYRSSLNPEWIGNVRDFLGIPVPS